MPLIEQVPGPLAILQQLRKSGGVSFWIVAIAFLLFFLTAAVHVTVYVLAPVPRPPLVSETTYRTIEKNGKESERKKLPNWIKGYLEQAKEDAKQDREVIKPYIEPAEVFMSVVVPAYNEKDRLRDMLQEAVEFLESEYPSGTQKKRQNNAPEVRQRKSAAVKSNEQAKSSSFTGWEILIVSDGSTDGTEDVALDFAKGYPGSAIRVITLEKNRGKGGAVTHGMRHVRGQYIIFADADGASKFSDLAALVEGCQKVEDSRGCGVAIGSRAHLVGSEAVVNRSWLRNFLMHSFHMLLWVMTTKATAQIRDTQCGFKLFSRPCLPYITPHQYAEGWIFDVEMLMLAERAKIPMTEVPIGWHEVAGSKLNVVLDSVGMAWGLLVLRAAWGMGVYQFVEEQRPLSLEELKPNANPITHKEVKPLGP